MARRESNMWSTCRPLFAGLDAVRVENPICPGTPDVNYLYGWVELKALAAWPKRPGTPVRVPHYTPEQRIWAQRRMNAGGNVFLFLKVADEWLLFRGDTAARYLGKVSQKELIEVALVHWLTCPTQKEFQQWILHPFSQHSTKPC